MGQDHRSSNNLVIIGSIGAPFGVHGWLKVNSYTEPRSNILNFKQWLLVNKPSDDCNLEPHSILEVKELQDKFLVLFSQVKDRCKAATLTNKKIAVRRQELPELLANEYYFSDLIGIDVYNLSDQKLGIVDHIFSTKANDVMVIKSIVSKIEYLIPSDKQFILNVDLLNNKMLVNWVV